MKIKQNYEKRGEQNMEQKTYWTVEIEGLPYTRERKIWNESSALATYELEKWQADRMGRKITLNIFKDGIKKEKIK